MIEYDKVIRIALDAELFYDEISSDSTELWLDYEDWKNNQVHINFCLHVIQKN